jgi:hypothetical protein
MACTLNAGRADVSKGQSSRDQVATYRQCMVLSKIAAPDLVLQKANGGSHLTA